MVVPELQRRGLHHKDYKGPTLRDNLGLAQAEIGDWKQRWRLRRRPRMTGGAPAQSAWRERLDWSAAAGISTRETEHGSADKFRNLMRHQAGAVTIIAVGEPGNRTGLTATAMCSLTDSPPTVLDLRQPERQRARADQGMAQCFSVNVLAQRPARAGRRFSTKKLEGEARFDADDWETLATGAPVLKGTIASLDCELVAEQEVETHSIFIGRVGTGRFREDAEPLLYFRGDFWDVKAR